MLTERDLDYLTHLDYWDHFAWGAVRADRCDKGIGVACYIRLQSEPEVAEAAVTVGDQFQRRGLGTYLLGLLSAAGLAAGISTFRAYVLEENVPMRKLLKGWGPEPSSTLPASSAWTSRSSPNCSPTLRLPAA